MSVPAFMQKYLDALIALMESVHAANLTICTDTELGSETELLCGKWEHIIGTHQAAAKLVSEETEYLKAYQDLRKLLVQYNVHVGQSKNQDLQLLVVNELQALEVVCIRLYSGPMYKRYLCIYDNKFGKQQCMTLPFRYNDVSRGQVKGVYSTTIALTSSAQIKLSKITKACKVVCYIMQNCSIC